MKEPLTPNRTPHTQTHTPTHAQASKGPYKNYFNISHSVKLEQNETRSIVLQGISRASAALEIILSDSYFLKFSERKIQTG
jgi:hypothetical protein